MSYEVTVTPLGDLEVALTSTAFQVEISQLGDESGMAAAIYDPQSIASDAFDRANHTGTQTLATISDAGTAAGAATGDFATAAQGNTADTAVQPGDIGTAAPLNVPATGDAAVGEVVKGDDTRLSDARAPTAHTHTKADITDFSDGDYATAAQGAKADTAQQPPTEGAFVDGDKTKLDGIEALADVTDTANVTAAGALMDSEVTNLAAVKAFDPADYVQPGDDADTLGSGAATDGQVLTADGTGGAAWEDAGGGGLIPLSKSVITSSTANVIFTLPAGYSTYKLVFFGLRNDTDAERLSLVTSSDGGATFDVGASDYRWSHLGPSDGSDLADGSIEMGGSGNRTYRFGSVAGVSVFGELDIQPGGGTLFGHVSFRTHSFGENMFIGNGYRLSTTAFDAVRVQLINPILLGNFYLYGVKEPA